jgi:hypothetical protein
MAKRTGSKGSGQTLISEWTESPGQVPACNEGDLWIGRHTADEDLLVFDSTDSATATDSITFYSLTQHRQRCFPRSVVAQQIHGFADDLGRHRARRAYEDRISLRQERADAAAEAQVDRAERQRQNVLEAHRRYIAAIGHDYPGVTPSEEVAKPRRRSRCHACGIGLDDFASAVCVACNGVLCSCGTCACVGRATSAEEEAV